VADCAMLAQSYSQFKIGNNSLALALSWLIIETYINEMWRWWRWTLEPRKSTLTGGQNYTVSKKAKKLKQMGVFTFDMFQRVDKVRKLRNEVIHDRYECSLEDAASAINLVVDIIREKSGVHIPLDLTQFTST
jgi:hypothetical protein